MIGSDSGLRSGAASLWWNLNLEALSVPERFGSVAQRYPDAIALDFGESKVSYRELASNAHAAAGQLAQDLPGRGQAIGLLLAPTVHFFSYYLGILQSGNICLPIDPGVPQMRLRAILEACQPAALLVSPASRSLLRGIPDQPQTIEIDGDLALESGAVIGAAAPASEGVIYLTSGSTGEPKGVTRNHTTMLHHAMVYSTDSAVTASDRQSFLYSVQSGASMPDMLGALLNGAALCPFDMWGKSARQLADWVENHGITLLHLPVPLFRLMLEALDPSQVFSKLRLVLVGGEAVFREDIERGRQHVNRECVFVHQLASTEANYITRHFIHSSTPIDSNIVPVGRPARDKSVALVDDDGEPVAPGESGEIVVGSRYLASGYWSDEELTAMKFASVRHDPGVRSFKTGDLGRFDGAGLLHHLGRRDSQIRIRSHRVEIGEIESALARLPGIRQAAAAAYVGAGDNDSLVAYIVPHQGQQAPPLDRLRRDLARSLPDHMLPSALIELSGLPLLRSGKVDRTRLPGPAPRRPALSTEYQAARNTEEIRLVQIWEKVLGFRPIGVRDSFFGMGGNSLQAMRIIARIGRVFGEAIPQSSLLQAPTIEAQAILLTTTRAERPNLRAVGIQRGGDRRPLFCVSPRTVDVLAYRQLAFGLGQEQPFYALYSVDMPPRPPNASRMEHEAAVFLEEILSIDAEGPYRLGGYSHGGIVALEIAQQLKRAGKEVELLLLLDVYGPDYRKMLPYLPDRLYRPLQSLRSLQKAVDEFVPWFSQHWAVLSQLPWLARWHYASRKFVNHLRWLGGRVRRLARKSGTRQSTVREESQAVRGSSYRGYMPEPYDGRVVIFRAQKQPLGIQYDLSMGWQRVLKGKVDVITIPGYHDSILFRPRLNILIQHLGRILDELDGDNAHSP